MNNICVIVCETLYGVAEMDEAEYESMPNSQLSTAYRSGGLLGNLVKDN